MKNHKARVSGREMAPTEAADVEKLNEEEEQGNRPIIPLMLVLLSNLWVTFIPIVSCNNPMFIRSVHSTVSVTSVCPDSWDV